MTVSICPASCCVTGLPDYSIDKYLVFVSASPIRTMQCLTLPVAVAKEIRSVVVVLGQLEKPKTRPLDLYVFGSFRAIAVRRNEL